ncbi:Alpha/beta hydrolase [Collimonas fungivorans Ter331]|uniref:Alpha/beta hydrolase n=1 Tax=Collimonas fungivorans (strain Ter331) TaxID=1005048 RepID=G0AEA4_COLFT|nr:Alpha/beta hydrolase [Collimonas fungivorans Ter331]
MNAQTLPFFIAGAVGQLECALDLPDPATFAAPRGLALVAHPHPLFGGTMDNKVVHTLARGFLALGYVTVRMNFRGVGKSEGTHDEGRGETDDMALLLAHMRRQYPDLPLTLGGFSFGTFVQAQLQQRLEAAGAPAAATPAERRGAGRHRCRQVADADRAGQQHPDPRRAGRYDSAHRGIRMGAPAGHPGDRDSRRRSFFSPPAATYQESHGRNVASLTDRGLNAKQAGWFSV